MTLVPRESPGWEKAVGAVGGFLVVALLVGLALDEDSPAQPTTSITSIERRGEVWLADVRVVNEGGQTVQELRVAAELTTSDGTALETTEATVPYLAAGGSQHVSLLFASTLDCGVAVPASDVPCVVVAPNAADPQPARLRVWPAGFTQP